MLAGTLTLVFVAAASQRSAWVSAYAAKLANAAESYVRGEWPARS
jgi:hypothetical protein